MAGAHTLPGLDEGTFQQMLEAAFVLQERRKQQPVLRRKLEIGDTLAEIAATQEVLHSKEWDLKTSALLIAEQLQKITSATGVAVAVIREDQLEYCAAVGNAASLTGMAVPIDSGLSEFLQTAATDPALIAGLLKRQNSKSPFLFPVYHEGKVSGLLDVRFAECDAIPEQEVQSCQVMAGLMGQAIASATKKEWKQALAAERATMLDVLERLRPQLERLAAEEISLGTVEEAEPAEPAQERTAPEIEALLTAMSQAAEKNGTGATCGQCGYQFGDRELFCGRCGTPRLMSAKPEELDFLGHTPSAPQSSPAVEAISATKKEESYTLQADSPWLSEVPLVTPAEPMPAQPPRETPLTDGSPSLALNTAAEEVTVHQSELQKPEDVSETEPEEVQEEAIVPVIPQPEAPTPANWTSAAGALEWLKSLEKTNSPGRIWLAKHRGDISIALSALVLLIALTGWGLHPGSARNPNQPNLTLFERMLVSLGLAEAPPQPTATGNPNVWVWVDVHTALYYCPGSDLYGKTSGGKFALQRDAQIDQFQPAERTSCK
jgi:hypothetical protein